MKAPTPLGTRLVQFNFRISHVPGKDLVTADKLFRAPINREDGYEFLPKDIDLHVNYIFAYLPSSDNQIENIKEKQAQDEVCRRLA